MKVDRYMLFAIERARPTGEGAPDQYDWLATELNRCEQIRSQCVSKEAELISLKVSMDAIRQDLKQLREDCPHYQQKDGDNPFECVCTVCGV